VDIDVRYCARFERNRAIVDNGVPALSAAQAQLDPSTESLGLILV
jgi:hypothetical protein